MDASSWLDDRRYGATLLIEPAGRQGGESHACRHAFTVNAESLLRGLGVTVLSGDPGDWQRLLRLGTSMLVKVNGRAAMQGELWAITLRPFDPPLYLAAGAAVEFFLEWPPCSWKDPNQPLIVGLSPNLLVHDRLGPESPIQPVMHR